jgi:hypothetical protein
MAEVLREEFGLFFADDQEEPLVIYSDEEEALEVASFGDGWVLHRVITVETVGEWEPNDRQPTFEDS